MRDRAPCAACVIHPHEDVQIDQDDMTSYDDTAICEQKLPTISNYVVKLYGLFYWKFEIIFATR